MVVRSYSRYLKLVLAILWAGQPPPKYPLRYPKYRLMGTIKAPQHRATLGGLGTSSGLASLGPHEVTEEAGDCSLLGLQVWVPNLGLYGIYWVYEDSRFGY